MVLECVEEFGGGVWFTRDVCIYGVCVMLKNWLLHSRSMCGVFVCEEVGVCDGLCVFCEVWVLRCALFSVGVEVCEGR